MSRSIISESGWERIFEGVLSAQLTRKGHTNHIRMLGFRHVSKEVMQHKRCSVEMDILSCPDNRGVYSATWVDASGRKIRQLFFPKEWTRGQVLVAIAEAYETRGPKKWETPGNFYEGRTREGLRIVLELDENEQVIDAIPRKSNTSFEQMARWRVWHGYSKHGKYFCGVCGQLKRGHELGHRTPVSRFYRRVRYHARKLVYGVGRLIRS